MNMDNLGTLVATSGGGFFTGVLMGWALKKILKLFAVMAGLILTGLAILQYQQVASVNWDKVEGTISTIANATTNTLNHYNIETRSNKHRYSSYLRDVCRFCNWLHERVNKMGKDKCYQHNSKFF
jgi:uncharacterized membrane protein (Fun14 family)